MPNTSITIGLNNTTPNALYQYEVGLCASGNYDYTIITPDTFISIDLAEESWYEPGLDYCYRICEVNGIGEVIGCCCEGEGDSPYELIVEERYVRGCCEASTYTAEVQSYFEITEGTYTVGNGECYEVGTLSDAEPVGNPLLLLNSADCGNNEECTECKYRLRKCGGTEAIYTAVLDTYQVLNVGPNGDTIQLAGACYYFEYGTANGSNLNIDNQDINVNQGCEECQDPSPQITYRIVNCQYPWGQGGNSASINFVDGYTPQIGTDMVFGNYGAQESSQPSCWTITQAQPIYIPNAIQLTQSDIIDETNCTDCIEENYVAWSVENCNDSSDTLVIALLATTPDPNTDPTGVNADTILINGNCYFFSSGPGNINDAETLITDLDENPITTGGCSSCSST